MEIKINSKYISVNGNRVGVTYAVGPWVGGIDPTTIKIFPKKLSFPSEILSAFAFGNSGDIHNEKDCIHVTSTHPGYVHVMEAAFGGRFLSSRFKMVQSLTT